MNGHADRPDRQAQKNESTPKEISAVLKEIEMKVIENRGKFDDSGKTIKDFRRIFDQDSSRMNKAIFNDSPAEEIHEETLRTISILIEILERAKKNKA
jgi:hypothetical protein